MVALSPRWFTLVILVAFILAGILFAVALPETPHNSVSARITVAPTASLTASAGPTTTGTPTPRLTPSATTKSRPDVGPPATNMGFRIATPEFATNVPLPRTSNFDLSQLVLGRGLYTQWCATCHGDRGQGLDLWRSSWDPDHQNCTQAGCHGIKHFPDGFSMLKIPPALIGGSSLKTYQNAFQLFTFIRASMPYQAPGVFSDPEYWAVTAFLADQHGADANGKVLDDSNAPGVLLPTSG